MNDHREYDQQRALQKLEQQRQEALREAARRAKSPEQARKDQEAINAFYKQKGASMPGSAGKKAGGCPPVLVALIAGVGAVVYALSEVARALV